MPKKSGTMHEGAELERRAFKAYLRRQIKDTGGIGPRNGEALVKLWLEGALKWTQGRCDRYKARKGGL